MTGVEVGYEFLNLTADVFAIGDKKGTIIDSGTTLAYLPEVIYKALIRKVCIQTRCITSNVCESNIQHLLRRYLLRHDALLFYVQLAHMHTLMLTLT